MRKIMKGAGLFVLGALVIVLLGAVVTQHQGPAPASFSALASRYDVEIIRDQYGVPHIYGDRDTDVAFGLAYAHAQDDYETIENVLLATRGIIARKTGVDGAVTDYLIAFMRVWEAVDRDYDTKVSAKARGIAEAYADGINYWLSQNPAFANRHTLPVTGKDIVAGFTFKTPLFYGFDKALAAVYDGQYGTRIALEDSRLRATRTPDMERGSQGLAVAPARSKDGQTYLLVNSHQPLTGPVAWYEVRVKSNEGWDMLGSTFPGSPVVLHGVGPTLGWSSTVNKPDLVDVYQMVENPKKPDHYLLDGQWIRYDKIDIPITVKLAGPLRWTVTETAWRSVHGPVVRTKKGSYALRWAGMGTTGTLDQFIAMNKARTRADFEAALAMGQMPSINYIYADRDGQIAHYYNAMFPDRLENPVDKTGKPIDWRGLLPGDRSDLIWRRYRPFEAMPRTVNPASGAVFNANNRPDIATDGAGAPALASLPQSMGVEGKMTNRAHRLMELLRQYPDIGWEDFRAIKYDDAVSSESPMGRALLQLMTRPLPEDMRADPRLVDARRWLKTWDWRTNQENRQAALAILTAFPTIGAQLEGRPPPPTREGFKAAVELLHTHFGGVDITWGEVNRLRRGTVDLPLDGGPDILRAVYGWPADEQGRLTDLAGDSYILFASWDENGLTRAQSVHNFGSATLNASSPHYADQSPLFARKVEKSPPLDRASLDAQASGRIGFGRFAKPGTR